MSLNKIAGQHDGVNYDYQSLEEAFKQEGGEYIDIERNCWDCGRPVRVRVWAHEKGYDFQGQDGAVTYGPEIDDKIEPLFKCPECYQQQPKLYDWNPCEVYSRVVGYYRPIQNFNIGKQEEYKRRANYQFASSDSSDTFFE